VKIPSVGTLPIKKWTMGHSARAFQGGGGFTIAKAFTMTLAKRRNGETAHLPWRMSALRLGRILAKVEQNR